ncbi:hypothetical protein AXX12_15515 [Anaerosporomusa subterranea]|uniref:Uncharacterized protein n=1 Tax=Anaerosporomusa subterranea TaxID=1794912 RepID=A0A154BM42_ANASB|nr:hypothetical protein [Anaerosporomusa subterranea]KYZ74986.1 hypothetical protein AXX12_15515 [Anaerosporomusa subterranea]
MEDFNENHSGRVDQPLAHEAGVNHTINAADQQLKARNLHTAKYLARTMLWEQQEKVDSDDIEISEQNTIEIHE